MTTLHHRDDYYDPEELREAMRNPPHYTLAFRPSAAFPNAPEPLPGWEVSSRDADLVMFRNRSMERVRTCEHDFAKPSEPGGPVTCTNCELAVPCPHPQWIMVDVKTAVAPIPRGVHRVCGWCGAHEPVSTNG